MLLYHYTCEYHLESIRSEGLLRVTESNIGSPWRDVAPFGEHFGPDVVWLTSSQRPSGHYHGLNVPGAEAGGIYDKTKVRITVDVPDARHWPRWSREQGISPRWRRALEKDRYPDTWYVVERPILEAEWVGIDVLEVV